MQAAHACFVWALAFATEFEVWCMVVDGTEVRQDKMVRADSQSSYCGFYSLMFGILFAGGGCKHVFEFQHLAGLGYRIKLGPRFRQQYVGCSRPLVFRGRLNNLVLYCCATLVGCFGDPSIPGAPDSPR